MEVPSCLTWWCDVSSSRGSTATAVEEAGMSVLAVVAEE